MCEHIYEASFDGTVAGDYAVAEKRFFVLAEVCAAVAHKHVELLERAFVEQLCDAFAGGVFTAFVLLFDGLFAAAEAGLGAELYELLYFFKLTAHYFDSMILVWVF